MPKFLDAPSWYDESGSLKNIYTARVQTGGAYAHSTNYSYYTDNSSTPTFYAFGENGTHGEIAYYDGYGPGWLSPGTSGQVLVSSGTGRPPSWGDIKIPKMWGISFSNSQPGSPATNWIQLYIMSSTNPNITNMYGVQDLIQATQESGNWITISLINGYVNNSYRPVSISYQNKTTQPRFTGLLIEGWSGSTSTTVQISNNTYSNYTVKTYPYDFTSYIP